ncbi:MAG: septal ring lytic transglycosylase RlpA family protein [Chitinophagaceae bacterium]
MYGNASFYSSYLHGSKTATGGRYLNEAFTAASNNFKLHTWVKVTNVKNGKTVIVQINDRMHKRMTKKGRILDLSKAAAKKLDFIKSGITKVKAEVIEKPDSQ